MSKRITDEKFLRCYEKIKNWPRGGRCLDELVNEFFSHSFTYWQMKQMCEVWDWESIPCSPLHVVNQPNMTSNQLTTLMRRFADSWFIREVIYNIHPLTPEQIEFGLSHDDEIVRRYASRHPNCTETQKVKHLLKWGQT